MSPAVCASVSAFVLASIPATALAGGWTQKPGHGYVKAWTRWQADVSVLGGPHHGAGDERFEIGEYHEIGLGVYAEYGIVERFTVLANWRPITGYFLTDDNRDQHVATGDPTVGFRWGIVQGEWVFAFQGTVTAPLGPDAPLQPVVDIDTGEEFGALRAGAGVWDVSPRVQFGFGFERGYFGFESAYVYRSGGFQDAYTWMIEGGYRFVPKLMITVRFQQFQPTGKTSKPPSDSPSGVGNATRYLGFAFEADWSLGGGWSIGGVLEGATHYEHQGGGPVFNLYGALSF